MLCMSASTSTPPVQLRIPFFLIATHSFLDLSVYKHLGVRFNQSEKAKPKLALADAI